MKNEMKWIPVTERLPEVNTIVLVTYDNGVVDRMWQNWASPNSCGNYRGEPLAYCVGDDIPVTPEEWKQMKHYVVAWMPMPEPYKEGE